MNESESYESALRGLKSGISRRELLIGGGRWAGAAAGLFALGSLAACGSSSSGSSNSGGTTAAAGTSGAAASGGGGGDIGAQLAKILPLPSGKSAGKGLSLTVPVADAYSGTYAANGVDRAKGQQLAVKHILAAGGPNLKLTTVDTQGNPANAPTYMRTFGLGGYPVMMTAGAGNAYSEFPFYPQYKLLSIDCGGAAKNDEGKPFYYMSRAEVPGQIMPTIVNYAKEKLPDLKNWVVLTDDYGAQLNAAGAEELNAVFVKYGFPKPTYVYQTPGSSDYSTSLSKIRAAKPDAVFQYEFGTPVSLFMNQYATAGIGKQVFAMDYSTQMAQVAKSSFEGLIFGFDYFDVYNPPNAWAKLFTTEFEQMFNYTPSYYCANAYETTFLIWQLISRILDAGGDPTKQGDSYVNAISKSPTTFWSVYGPGNGQYGTMEIDPKTHALTSRPIAVLQQTTADPNTAPKLLATSGVDGTDFKLAT